MIMHLTQNQVKRIVFHMLVILRAELQAILDWNRRFPAENAVERAAVFIRMLRQIELTEQVRRIAESN